MSKTPKNTEIITFIYTLEDPDTHEIRYVGKTVKSLNDRLTGHIYSCRREHNHRTNWIKSVLKRDKKPLIKLVDSCSWSKSQELECYWISKFKKQGANLVNMTDGGEGNLGLKLSKERLAKLIAGIEKKVYQYDLKGVFIKEYKSVAEATRQLKVCTCSKISMAALGRRKKAGNFLWSYVKHDCLNEYKRLPTILSTENMIKLIDRRSLPVLQYSLNNIFIKEWKSAKVAAKTLELDYISIIEYLNGKRTVHQTDNKTGNYIWKRKIVQ